MSTTLRTPEQVVEFALKRIGYGGRVQNLLNGSREAQAALAVYGQERDAELAAGEWDFCERTVNGTLLKQAPASYAVTPWTTAFPSLPWQFEYAYPVDAVKIRTVKAPVFILPNFDPRYNRFSVDNDAGLTPPQKVILCNVPQAIILYAGQVTDPNEWTADFLDALADRLGKALAPLLKDMNAVKLAAAEEQADTVQAAGTRG